MCNQASLVLPLFFIEQQHNLKQMFEELSTELILQQPGWTFRYPMVVCVSYYWTLISLLSKMTANPKEFIYDQMGKLLDLPPRNGASASTEKPTDGFQKLKLVAESLDSNGSTSCLCLLRCVNESVAFADSQ